MAQDGRSTADVLGAIARRLAGVLGLRHVEPRVRGTGAAARLSRIILSLARYTAFGLVSVPWRGVTAGRFPGFPRPTGAKHLRSRCSAISSTTALGAGRSFAPGPLYRRRSRAPSPLLLRSHPNFSGRAWCARPLEVVAAGFAPNRRGRLARPSLRTRRSPQVQYTEYSSVRRCRCSPSRPGLCMPCGCGVASRATESHRSGLGDRPGTRKFADCFAWARCSLRLDSCAQCQSSRASWAVPWPLRRPYGCPRRTYLMAGDHSLESGVAASSKGLAGTADRCRNSICAGARVRRARRAARRSGDGSAGRR